MPKTPLELHRDLAFESMATRLNEALDQFRKDSALPATQAALAELAACSRRLFATPERRWVADKLKVIKRRRKRAVEDERVSMPKKVAPSVLGSSTKELETRIRNLMNTCGELNFERERLVDDLAAAKKELERAASERDQAKETAAQYRSEIQAIKAARARLQTVKPTVPSTPAGQLQAGCATGADSA